MKRHLLLPVLALVATSCQTGSGAINDHWNTRSNGPRIARFVLGYDAERDGSSYRDFAWERKQSINLTMRRHFLHHNPDNPNHAELPSRFEPRPPNSLLPNPVNYIHWEGLVLGLIGLGAGGAYIPLPVDSILGTLEPGTEGEMSGKQEFMAGVERTFGETLGAVSSTFVHKWLEPPAAGITGGVHRILD